MKDQRRVKKIEGHNLIMYGDCDSWTFHVTARSRKHAIRVMGELCMYGYDGGPGRAYADEPWYSDRQKRVIQTGGMDF